MGSIKIKEKLDEFNLNAEVIALVERLLDMVDDKDKNIAEMQKKIDELRKREGQLKTLAHDKEKNLAETIQQVEILETKETQLNHKVDEKIKENAALHKQVSQLKTTQQELKATVDSLNAAIQNTNIPKFVQELKNSGSWSSFKHVMKRALDKDGEAYRQLREVTHSQGGAGGGWPLRAVCSGGRTALLSLLLHAGLPAHTPVDEASGDTLVHAAAAAGDLHSLKLLLDCGGGVAAKNAAGRQSLAEAAAQGQAAAAKVLLARGAAPGARDLAGRVALHGAAEAGHAELVKLLVEFGADIVVKDDSGVTPLDLAISNGRDTVVELLLPLAR